MIKLKFNEVKDEISRIAAIVNPEICQDELKKLDKKLSAAKIKKVKQGDYYYFYEIEYYYDTQAQHSRERILRKIGQLPGDQYKKNKNKIDKMTKKELKKFLKNKGDKNENQNNY